MTGQLDQRTLSRLSALLRDTGSLSDSDLAREVRGAAPATRNRANEADVPRTTGGGEGGLDTPWTWVRNDTRIEPVTDSDGDTFDEIIIERVVLQTASGVELIIPTGL